MSIEFSTREYEFAHGKKPRGTGNWAFFFDHKDDIADAFWATGSFAQAKKMAIAWAVTKGHTFISVGS